MYEPWKATSVTCLSSLLREIGNRILRLICTIAVGRDTGDTATRMTTSTNCGQVGYRICSTMCAEASQNARGYLKKRFILNWCLRKFCVNVRPFASTLGYLGSAQDYHTPARRWSKCPVAYPQEERRSNQLMCLRNTPSYRKLWTTHSSSVLNAVRVSD
jgi:hypothetical protein